MSQACATPRAPARNKRLVYQQIILGDELNLLVIVMTLKCSAGIWKNSTADLCQQNCW